MLRAACAAAFLLALVPTAEADDTLVCLDATRCAGIDGDGHVCTPVGCIPPPVEDGEVHACAQIGCLHANDDEDDGEVDYATFAFTPLGLEQMDCHAHAWVQEARGLADCTAVDHPDEFDHTVASAVVTWNATGHENETRFHDVTVDVGIYETENGGFTFEEVVVSSHRVHDHEAEDADPEGEAEDIEEELEHTLPPGILPEDEG